jgi:hypothetical protein
MEIGEEDLKRLKRDWVNSPIPGGPGGISGIS